MHHRMVQFFLFFGRGGGWTLDQENDIKILMIELITKEGICNS